MCVLYTVVHNGSMDNIEKKKKKNRNIVVCRRCWQNKIKMYLVVIFSVNRVTLLRFRFVEKERPFDDRRWATFSSNRIRFNRMRDQSENIDREELSKNFTR